MFAMARLVVSQQLQVLAADKGLIHVLGCNPDEANGQSVLSFIGPRSNMRLLQSQIHCMTGEKVLILYDHAGDERRTIVSCSPYHRESCFVGCLLKLHLSEAVALQDVLLRKPLGPCSRLRQHRRCAARLPFGQRRLFKPLFHDSVRNTWPVVTFVLQPLEAHVGII